MISPAFMPVLLPLLGGILLLIIRSSSFKTQQIVSFLLTLLLVGVAICSLGVANQGMPQIYTLGNWIAPFGIVLVLDQLSAMMVLVTSLLAVASLWYAISTKLDSKGEHFHILFQLQLFGLNGAFLTGDLFNLFVFFEILLLASYGLLLHGGGKLRTKAGLQFVVINLIGSTIFLFAVGALYGILGTLNIADMSMKIAQLPAENQGVVAAAGLLLLIVFGIKAAMFPLYLWLPQAYTNTSAPIAALFAIMTKIGIYSIIRTHGTLFGESASELSFYYMPWVLGLGLITLVMGAFGVAASKRLREQVSYLVLCSIATLLIGIGINSQESLSATLYYMVHSTIIAGSFFLLSDMISRSRGSLEDRFTSGISMHSKVLLGGTFMVIAIAMTGMPPFSGFIGKLLILSSALESSWFWLILAVVLISSLIMIISLARSGSLLFYNVQKGELCETTKLNKMAYMPILFLISLILLLVLFADNIVDFTDSISLYMYSQTDYIEAVLNISIEQEATR